LLLAGLQLATTVDTLPHLEIPVTVSAFKASASDVDTLPHLEIPVTVSAFKASASD